MIEAGKDLEDDQVQLNPGLPSPPLNRVPKHHICVFVEHVRGGDSSLQRGEASPAGAVSSLAGSRSPPVPKAGQQLLLRLPARGGLLQGGLVLSTGELLGCVFWVGQ